jgi:hypothetical protein
MRARLSDYGVRFREGVFGDRYGLIVFLGAIALFGVFWRVDVFMTDSATLYNALGAVEAGSLGIERPVVGADLASPGLYDAGGQPVGRNYAEVVLALPILLALRAASVVANLHTALVAAWHVAALWLGLSLGVALDRKRVFAYGTGTLVLVSFVLNLLLVRKLPEAAPYLLSLHLLTLVAAAMSAVVCYRLVSTLHTRRAGGTAAAVLALATPIGFWSAFPKRHVFTGLTLLAVLLLVVWSRNTPPGASVAGVPRSTALRATAYASIGLYAWVHAGEALFMLFAHAVVDLSTASRTDLATLSILGGAFALSLAPMLLTNYAISGDPFVPPRLLPNWGPTGSGVAGASGVSESSAAPMDTGFLGNTDSSGTGLPGVFARVRDIAVGGTATLLTDPERVVQTYAKSQPLTEMTQRVEAGQLRYAAANLSVLESMPLASGLVAGLALAIQRLRNRTTDLASRFTATDALAVAFALTFAVLYARRLPLVAQYTQRYLFPLYPLAIYGLARLSPTRRALRDHWRLAVWTYAAAVLVAGQLAFAFVVVQDLTVGEAFRLHALVNLGLGAVLAVTLTAAVFFPDRDRPAAVVLALAAAAGTVFVLLSALVYFPVGRYVLPVVEVLSGMIEAA